MKHHLTETHGHNFEIHDTVLFSQSISLNMASPDTPTPTDTVFLVFIYVRSVYVSVWPALDGFVQSKLHTADGNVPTERLRSTILI